MEKRIKFTYGNIPKNFKFRNTNLIEPQKDNKLSLILKSHQDYLTHQLMNLVVTIKMKGECVVALLYRDSGCMQEYCKGFGVSFTTKKIFRLLNMITKNYQYLNQK